MRARFVCTHTHTHSLSIHGQSAAAFCFLLEFVYSLNAHLYVCKRQKREIKKSLDALALEANVRSAKKKSRKGLIGSSFIGISYHQSTSSVFILFGPQSSSYFACSLPPFILKERVGASHLLFQTGVK